MNRTVYIVILLLSFATASAKGDKYSHQLFGKESYQSLSGSYVFGAQIYNDNFLYNPGGAIQASGGWKIHKDLFAGIGTGYTQLQKERFVPIYLEAIGFRKKKAKSTFVKFQTGYSYGWMEQETYQQDFEMKGGLYFSACIGQKIPVNDQFSLLFQLAYTHQYGLMEYEVFGSKDYQSELNFEMLWFTVGIMHL